jgi:hypothetical protein
MTIQKAKSTAEMTPEEREKENLRLMQKQIELVKSAAKRDKEAAQSTDEEQDKE